MGLKRVKIFAFGFVGAVIIQSCCPCKNLATTSETKTSDSVNVKTTVTEKEKSVFTAADSASIKALVKCPENGVLNLPEITKKSKNTTARVAIKNNIVSVDCKCDALEVKLKYQEKLTEIYKRHINTSNVVKVIETEKIPKWGLYFIVFGICSALFWTIKLVIKIYKTFI